MENLLNQNDQENQKNKQNTKSKLEELKAQLIQPVIINDEVQELETVLLEPRQRLFVTEYLKDFNGTQAAIRAGYSEKTAQEQSSRLLSKVIIKEEIARRQEIIQKSSNITRQYIQEEILNLIQDSYNDEKTDRQTITKCLDMLNKMNGFYQPDTTVNVMNNNNEIKILIVKPEENGN